MSADAEAPYAGLSPDLVLDAVESIGLRCDGRQLALNSYENRVLQVGLEEGAPVVVKFYRPGRWTDAAILEEHAFCAELAAAEIPAVPPLTLAGATLHAHGGFRFAVFPRQGGRPPELDMPGVLPWLGRYMGRIHSVGGRHPFRDRPPLDAATFGDEPRQWLLDSDMIPMDLASPWKSVSAEALEKVRQCYERAGPVACLRLHGDCHLGNVLWTDDGPHFVDFDDARNGPAIQDLWMLLSGDRETMGRQLGQILGGYEQFREFDDRELHLVEALRTLRLLHYSAWLGRRWHDPAFPAAFPWFGSHSYWQERIVELREQIVLMQEPPLVALAAY